MKLTGQDKRYAFTNKINQHPMLYKFQNDQNKNVKWLPTKKAGQKMYT